MDDETRTVDGGNGGGVAQASPNATVGQFGGRAEVIGELLDHRYAGREMCLAAIDVLLAGVDYLGHDLESELRSAQESLNRELLEIAEASGQDREPVRTGQPTVVAADATDHDPHARAAEAIETALQAEAESRGQRSDGWKREVAAVAEKYSDGVVQGCYSPDVRAAAALDLYREAASDIGGRDLEEAAQVARDRLLNMVGNSLTEADEIELYGRLVRLVEAEIVAAERPLAVAS